MKTERTFKSSHYVPLQRSFSNIFPSENRDEEAILLHTSTGQMANTWSELENEYRCVILAEAGAGKTIEMRKRAQHLNELGRLAFFLRIEDVCNDLDSAFEVGSQDLLKQWLNSQEQAWLFLDSVDESRLRDPRDFERAVKRLSREIKGAESRTHIFISSRPYAWRNTLDRELVVTYFPLEKQLASCPTQLSEHPTTPFHAHENPVRAYRLNPLERADIEQFAQHRSTPRLDALMHELERNNLLTIAGRPFDLDEILMVWKSEGKLGSRSSLLKRNIERKLQEIDPDSKLRRPLEPRRAREATKVIAAAMVLTGNPVICIPDESQEREGMEAEALLPEWNQSDIKTLLERAVFDGPMYGAVRFRNREVRELLCAEWFADLLNKGNARHAIESLFFREQYGQTIIAPRLRPVLPWLILADTEIRHRARSIAPDIALKGGDPSRLPLAERKEILNRVAMGIEQDEQQGALLDNRAIASIAKPDLAGETACLIERYTNSDDVLFFLCRLAWYGDMSVCVPLLMKVAQSQDRGLYARRVAIRGVVKSGTVEQGYKVWESLLSATALLPYTLLAEIVQNAPFDADCVDLLIRSLDRLEPYDRFKASELIHALYKFIDRASINKSINAEQLLSDLITAMSERLDRAPFVEHHFLEVSKEFAWLLSPATHGIERLVAKRSPIAMQDHVFGIVLKTSDAQNLRNPYTTQHWDALREAVENWPRFNDSLFWAHVSAARPRLENSGNKLISVAQLMYPSHAWEFGPDSFHRVVKWIRAKTSRDDRLIALSLAYRIHESEEQPRKHSLLQRLYEVASGDEALENRLDDLLQPKATESEARLVRQREEWKKRGELQIRERQVWIEELKRDPSRIANSNDTKAGELSEDQLTLLDEFEACCSKSPNLDKSSAWRALIEEFGVEVARAFKEATMNHWRNYDPGLRSENAGEGGGWSRSLDFAQAGLQFELHETGDYLSNLSEGDYHKAIRYMVWEFNGYSSWCEKLFRLNPNAVLELLNGELVWELTNTQEGQPKHYVLQNLVFNAHWAHKGIAVRLIDWLLGNDPSDFEVLRLSLRLLKSGQVCPQKLAALARAKVKNVCNPMHTSLWYALWVDTDPVNGIDAVERWLNGLAEEQQSQAAQQFAVALMGTRHVLNLGPSIGRFKAAEYLSNLYQVVLKYIRIEDDIDRSDGQVYSPGLRDDAQDARNGLLRLLVDIPGKETYIELTKLIKEQFDSNSRTWLFKQREIRTETDGDLEHWTEEQVLEFQSDLTATPLNHRQLYDLTINQLTELAHRLEQSHFSQYQTWRKASNENELRNLIASWLNDNMSNRATIAQEPELANGQRIDIRIQNPNANSSVPIEVKVAEKWSGPNLCERIRNQLAGDYLRDCAEGCGVLLLVQKNNKTEKRWRIDGHLYSFADLSKALTCHWYKVSNDFPNVANIRVISIDLESRDRQSSR